MVCSSLDNYDVYNQATDPKTFSIDLSNQDRNLENDKRYIALTTCKVTTDINRTVLLGELTESKVCANL